MTLRTRPSETFVNQGEDLKQREEILAGDLLGSEKGLVHYYRSEMEVDDEEVQEDDLEYNQSPTAVENDHISKFLKLPTTSKKTRKIGRAKPLVDYS